MKRQDHNIQAALALIKAGLWEKAVWFADIDEIEYSIVYQFAQEQAVLGLLAAGIEYIENDNVPQDLVLEIIGNTLQIEQQNLSMNDFVARLFDELKKEGIPVILVKGQGIAQCYERPLWRPCGDVDLVVDRNNYEKAKTYLKARCKGEGIEIKNRLHMDYTIESWVVELHGSLCNGLWKRMDRIIELVLNNYKSTEDGRVWINNGIEIKLPHVDDDVILVFSHILQHFFRGGVGLRQICDWCRLLWTYREEINKNLLEQWLHNMRIVTEWKAFAALAVEYLGMPVEAMPLYNHSKKWGKKGDQLLSLIINTGNLGQARNLDYYNKYPYPVIKTISLYKNTLYSMKQFVIFPIDSIRGWWRMIMTGIEFATR